MHNVAKTPYGENIYHYHHLGKQSSSDCGFEILGNLLSSGTSFWEILGAVVGPDGSGGPTVSLKMRLSCRPQ